MSCRPHALHSEPIFGHSLSSSLFQLSYQHYGKWKRMRLHLYSPPWTVGWSVRQEEEQRPDLGRRSAYGLLQVVHQQLKPAFTCPSPPLCLVSIGRAKLAPSTQELKTAVAKGNPTLLARDGCSVLEVIASAPLCFPSGAPILSSCPLFTISP